MSALVPAPGEQYTIRRQVLRLLGGGFHIYGKEGQLTGYCEQKAFRLKEDLRVFTDESKSELVLRVAARSIIDFSSTYDFFVNERLVGSMQRKGLKSSLVRDEWKVLDPSGNPIGLLQEESGLLAILRRMVKFFALFSPEKFVLKNNAGQELARLRQHFNPFIYRLGVRIEPSAASQGIDERFVLGMGCLLAAVEGRQD